MLEVEGGAVADRAVDVADADREEIDARRRDEIARQSGSVFSPACAEKPAAPEGSSPSSASTATPSGCA